MAKCKLCGKEKGSSASCVEHHIRIAGEYFKAVPYKARNKTLYEIQNNIVKRCPSCGVKEGGYHHIGCILEVCPKCKKFWLSCSCFGIKVLLRKEEAKVLSFPGKKEIFK